MKYLGRSAGVPRRRILYLWCVGMSRRCESQPSAELLYSSDAQRARGAYGAEVAAILCCPSRLQNVDRDRLLSQSSHFDSVKVLTPAGDAISAPWLLLS